jgi:hypothetical protein
MFRIESLAELTRSGARSNEQFHMIHPERRAISRDLQATELVDDHHRECWINHWS